MQAATAVCAELPANYWRAWKAYGRRKARLLWTPASRPVTSTRRCVQKIILGGRFLQQVFTGDMTGLSFSGIDINGFDNHTEKYVSTRMDSIGTGIYYFQGDASADGKIITQICLYDDPVKGPMTRWSVTKIMDENTQLFEMYGTDRTGEEEKMMEIDYTQAP
jgi:hypothetical protein